MEFNPEERKDLNRFGQTKANQIMETEEQREQRLELTKIMCDEISRGMIKMIKRNANKAPTVSDKIRRLPIK